MTHNIPHKTQTFVAGVHLDPEATNWIAGKDVGMEMFDNSSSASIHFYKLTQAHKKPEQQELCDKMLKTIRVYDVWWNNLIKENG